MKFHQQGNPNLPRTQISQQLRLVQRRERFDFDPDASVNNNIRRKPIGSVLPYVDDRDRHQPRKWNWFAEFVARSFAADGFEQAWSDCLMDLVRQANAPAGQLATYQHAPPPCTQWCPVCSVFILLEV
jgi:hypothetical protein